MPKQFAAFYNGAYKNNPDEYPSQIIRLRKLAARLRHLGITGEFLPIYFEGDSVDEIHANLKRQVRDDLGRVLDAKKIFFGGDGFVGAMVNALGETRDELSAAGFEETAKIIDDSPVMVMEGGTLNLFAKRLASSSPDSLERFLEEDISVSQLAVRRRVLDLTAVDVDKLGKVKEEAIGKTQTYPFVFFAGTGTDSLMLKLHEEQSRKQHWALSIVKITTESLRDLWTGDGRFKLDALVTIPYYGLMRFPREIDTAGSSDFYRLSAESDNALKTSAVMLTGHVAMSNPLTAKIFLNSDQKHYSLKRVDGIQDELVKGNHPDGLCFYTDGFPQVFALKPCEMATVSAYTVDSPAVQMASFDMGDYKDDVQSRIWETGFGLRDVAV